MCSFGFLCYRPHIATLADFDCVESTFFLFIASFYIFSLTSISAPSCDAQNTHLSVKHELCEDVHFTLTRASTQGLLAVDVPVPTLPNAKSSMLLKSTVRIPTFDSIVSSQPLSQSYADEDPCLFERCDGALWTISRLFFLFRLNLDILLYFLKIFFNSYSKKGKFPWTNMSVALVARDMAPSELESMSFSTFKDYVERGSIVRFCLCRLYLHNCFEL
jgi:hypothetical protein